MHRGKKYKIGYCPGVFDLFHIGHLNLIDKCRQRCEYLIVGVLTDELVEFYKKEKPFIPYNDRIRIVAALRNVDRVVPVDFGNTDKMDAWNMYHFDCHFSGSDHGEDWDEIREKLHEVGAEMEFFPYTEGISSTRIKKLIKNEMLQKGMV